MSTRDNGVAEYALVIDEDTMYQLAEKICKDFNKDDWDMDQTGYEEDVATECNLDYISEFTGEALCIDDRGYASYYDYTYYGCDYIYYLPLKFPTLFTPAYESMQDLINECRSSKLAKYLPKDFDYRSNVRYVVGTYYG